MIGKLVLDCRQSLFNVGKVPQNGTKFSILLSDIKELKLDAGVFTVSAYATANGENLHFEVLEKRDENENF